MPTGATSGDGAENTAIVTALESYTAEKYPAFAWCVAKGPGWYLPGEGEWEFNDVHNSFNPAIGAVGGTEYSSQTAYWSSTAKEARSYDEVAVMHNGTPSQITSKSSTNYVRALLAF